RWQYKYPGCSVAVNINAAFKSDKDLYKVGQFGAPGFTIHRWCLFVVYRFWHPVFYKINWHFSERFIGFLLALNGILIALVEMVLVHNLEGKRNGLVFIMCGILIAALGFVLLNILPPTAVAAVIVVVLITFGEMMSMPFMNAFWIGRSTANNRGDYAALYSMTWSAGQVIAPLVGGEVIAYGGFNLLWWVLGALSLISSAGYFILYRTNYYSK